MVEALFHQVHFEVFPKDLDFASQVIVRAPHKLELALVFVRLHLLSNSFGAAFVVALNNLKQTSVIVLLGVFYHQHRHTFLILANDTSVAALVLMLVEVLPLHRQRTTIIEQRLSFVWTLNNLKFARSLAMLVHFSPVNLHAALVFARDFSLRASLTDVLVKLVKWKLGPAFQQTDNLPEMTLIRTMLNKVSFEYRSTERIIRTRHH